MARIPWLNYGVVGLSTAAAASLAFAGAFALQPPSSLQEAHEPRIVAVTLTDFKDERTVAAELDALQPATAALRLSGTVTSTACVPGGQLIAGKVLATVDGRPVLGLDSAVPFHRDIGPGAQGQDVEALRVRLESLGYAVAKTGPYSGDLGDAIRKLQKDNGLRSTDGVLHLEDVMWLPGPTVRIRSCDAMLGSPYAPGSPFVTVAGTLQSLRVVFPPGQPPAPGERLVSFGNASAPMAADGLVTDRNFLDEVSKSPDFAATQSSSNPKPLSVKTTLSAPLRVAKLPLSALFGVDGKTACVKAGDGAVHRVALAGSSLGAVLATFSAEVPREVFLGDVKGTSGC